MKKSRIMAIIVAVLMVAVLFAGCGSGTTAEPAAKEAVPASEAPAAEEPAAEEPASEAPASEEPAAEAAEVTDESQGIPADWEEVVTMSDKYPGPEVTLAEWLEQEKDLKGNEAYKIAYVEYSMQNEFPVLMANAAEKRAEQLGVTVDFFDAESDTNVELEAVENAIANGYDAIVINPVDSQGSAAVVAKCNEAGIPIVCVNALLDKLEGLAGSCSSDHVQSGEIVAQYIIEEVMGGTGTIVVPEGPFAQSATLDRSQGVYNVVRNNPGITILAHDTANWSRAEALDLMENWLNAYPDQIDAIVGENDEMALGCLQAAKTNSEKTVYAGGIDCIPDALTAIENGEMACTVLQDAIAQSVIGFDIAVKVLNGEFAEGDSTNFWVPYELVTPDKVEEYRGRTDLAVLD